MMNQPSNYSEGSLQDRLCEELCLLPGRLSRTFYMMASLDAQATHMNSESEESRAQLLYNIRNSTVHTAFEGKRSSHSGSPSHHHHHSHQQHKHHRTQTLIHQENQLSALQCLHQSQRKVLLDKLAVGKRASEWIGRAKSIINRYQQESNLIDTNALSTSSSSSSLYTKNNIGLGGGGGLTTAGVESYQQSSPLFEWFNRCRFSPTSCSFYPDSTTVTETKGRALASLRPLGKTSLYVDFHVYNTSSSAAGLFYY